jgi:membrane-bound metal-dependent hydrolase YbcI (DUF457 family)
MPSPVGHVLGGIAAGWHLAPEHRARTAVLLGFAGAAADLDLLVGTHRGPTHSVAAALLTGIVVALLTRSLRWGSAMSAAWGSHVLLDWLATDTSPPIGEMALWPLTRSYYESSLHLFPAISRRYWLAEFWTYNLKALAIELAILGPIAAFVIYVSRARPSRPCRPRGQAPPRE